MTKLGTLPDWCRETWEELLHHNPSQDTLEANNAIFDSKCHPLQRRSEWTWMIHLAERAPQADIIVEIGASRGGGVALWAENTAASSIASYEINGFPYEDLFRDNFKCVDFHFIHNSSLEQSARDSLTNWLDGDTIDVLFIDGQKTNSAFSKDFHNHLPLMSPGGIIFMHDITSTATQDWRRIEESGRYNTARIIDTSESLAAVQRERRGEPATTDYEKWLRKWRGRGAGVGVVFL